MQLADIFNEYLCTQGIKHTTCVWNGYVDIIFLLYLIEKSSINVLCICYIIWKDNYD